MRGALLLAADGTITSASDEARQLDPRLLPGVRLDTLIQFAPIASAIAAARRDGSSRKVLQLGVHTLEVSCSLANGAVFVGWTSTLAAPAGFERAVLDLVDVVLSGQQLPRVLDELCRTAESVVHGCACTVMVVDADGLLQPTAGPNLPATIIEATRNFVPGKGRGACGEAVWSREPVFAPDMRSDARFGGFQLVLSETGYRACWSWPVLAFNGEALGSFAIYAPTPGLPNNAQRGLMSTLVRLAALAIEHSRNSRATKDLLDRYHVVAEASTNVIYDWNLRTNTLEWSPRMMQVFGYSTEETLTFEWWEGCVHQAERERVVGSLQDAIVERRKTWNETYRFKRRSGSWATVIDRGHVLFDDDGTPTRLIGEMSDVSALQSLQARLALTERLASVGTLAAGVAHEINNPLAWITSNLHYAIEEITRLNTEHRPLSLDEVNEALKDARTGADRVSTIVRDLKLFSRAQDETNSLVDVRRVLESSITMARNEIRHRAQLERRFEDVPAVKGNEGKLSQVFLNLLINAAHAVPEGDVANHTVMVTTGLDENGQVLVQVRDTGQGIAADVLPHIFDPFFTTKPVGQGTGLGLSICHSIVTGLGGSIHVESTPGGGSTFKVTLPVAPPEFRRSPPPDLTKLPDVRGLVALIDDEPSVLLALQRVLGPLHDVRTFTEPLQALDALPTLKPDVIFCDVMMPELSGAEVYNRLRASHPTLADRLIFMTGGAFSSSAREFLDQVQRPVLEKPFTAEAVRRLATEHVAKVKLQS